jgi:pyruvate dehydrogenase E1 component
MYRLRQVGEGDGKHVRLLGSGAILREVEAAAETLYEHHGVTVEVFSVTSFTELAREAQDCARWNLLHPDEPPRVSHVARLLAGDAPVVAASDYMKALAEQLRSSIRAPYHVLGTDGFGRSDTRDELRHFFEVDRRFVTLAALKCLADGQRIPVDAVRKARDALQIDPDKPNPRIV